MRLLVILALLSSAHEVTLKWALNKLNPNPPVIHTRVYRALYPCTQYTLVESGNNGTSWTDENVKAGAKYCYFTTVRNPATGKESGKSNAITITVP